MAASAPADVPEPDETTAGAELTEGPIVEPEPEAEEPMDFETLAPALEARPEVPEVEPVEASEPDAQPEPERDDTRLGVSPLTRAQAIANGEARASQVSSAPSATPLTVDRLQATRVEFMDQYDSRWQRDPGRANGPFS